MLSFFKKRKIIIAIDGHSSCGKSTLAKDVAKSLKYIYVDSGAMYRAVTLYFIRNEIDYTDDAQVESALTKVNITFKNKRDKNLCYINGKKVEDEIRTTEVSDQVSEVAAISRVRSFLVAMQQEYGKNKGLVMDGRDISTVVFPDAELKLFVTADLGIRTQRRFLELKNKGYNVTSEEVRKNLAKRDHIDSTRDDSPLIQAADAIVLDNSNLTTKEQLKAVLKLYKYLT